MNTVNSNINRIVLLWLNLLLITACSNGSSGEGTERDENADASYRVTFNTQWSKSDFPVNFPSSAHFSPLIGATHNNQVKFWETAQFASNGIESMAETGATGSLVAEIEQAKNEGKAEFILSGQGAEAMDSIQLEFDINETYPLVTLVSMVAPSPDWFVGVRDLALFDDVSGTWKSEVSVPLKVYDAGTDSGNSFTSANSNTLPAEIISLLTSDIQHTDFINGVNSSNQHLASITFTRIE